MDLWIDVETIAENTTKWNNDNNNSVTTTTTKTKSQQANNEYVSRDMNNELYRRQKGNIRIPEDKRCLGRNRKKERKIWNINIYIYI